MEVHEDHNNSVILIGDTPENHSVPHDRRPGLRVLEQPPPKYASLDSEQQANERTERHDRRPGLRVLEQPPPKYALLDSVAARFEQQANERIERIEVMKSKQQSQLAHSMYLKENVVTPEELSAAAPVVNEWAKKHDVVGKTKRRILTAKRKTTSQSSMGDSSVIVLSPTVDQSYATGIPSLHGHRNFGNFEERQPKFDNDELKLVEQQNYNDIHQSAESTPRTNRSCAILNCDGLYNSEELFQEHRKHYRHSPCNPCVNIPNCDAPYLPQCYLCPLCGRDYPDDISCKAHMCKTNHLEFLSPLEVSVYICPQCTYFFTSKELCIAHMNERNHHDLAYPFEDDMKNPKIEPIAIGTGLMDDFIKECQEIPYKIHCVECEMEITNGRKLRDHELETQNTHVMSSYCHTTPAEVFVNYMREKTCTTCLQLFHTSECEEPLHNCTDSIKGVLMENDCKNFSEFVRRCSSTYQVRLKTTRQSLPESPCEVTSPSNMCFGAKAKGSPESPSLSSVTFLSETKVNPSHSRKWSGENKNNTTTPIPSLLELNLPSHPYDIPNRPTSSTWQSVEPSQNNMQIESAVSNSRQPWVIAQPKSNSNGSQLLGNDKLIDCGKDRFRQEVESSEDQDEIPPFMGNMKSILFLDLDNWPSFFRKLPFVLPERTFVWGFYGGASQWKEPSGCEVFDYQKRNGWFRLHEKCGRTKDAADFALVLTVGRMDVMLPKSIPFTILSGDKGFCEIERQMEKSSRRTVTINPHKTPETMVHTMIKSVVDA